MEVVGEGEEEDGVEGDAEVDCHCCVAIVGGVAGGGVSEGDEW